MKRILLLAIASCWFAFVALAAPANVIIRVPVGTPMPAGLAPLLAKWRQSGQVANVLLLTQGKAETAAYAAKFEAFALLEFSSDADCNRWEKEAAPALPAGLIVRRADALAHNEISPRDSSRSIFIVNTYTPTVPRERYNEFVQGYIKPLYEAMRGTTHLVRYTMYHERGETGKVDSLSVLEYRDSVAFDTITKVKPDIRAKLTETVPSYAQFDKIKDTLRTDGHGTRGTYTELPPPGN